MAAVAAIAESPATTVVTRKLLSGSTFSGSSAKAVIDISFGSIPYKYRVYTGSRLGVIGGHSVDRSYTGGWYCE